MYYNLNMSADLTFTALIMEVIPYSQNRVMYKCVSIYTCTYTYFSRICIHRYGLPGWH